MVAQAQPIEEAPAAAPPKHVAIIMDGNGRWAAQKGKPRSAGHRRGAEAVREAIEGALDLGIGYLTLYAFSSENWNRPEDEVRDLMGLLKLYLNREVKTMHKQKVRLRVIGRRDKLSADIQKMIERAEDLTAENDRMTLVIALSYGSRDEILDAAQKLARRVASGEMAAEEITESVFENALTTHGLPDPDLIIRTSGEQRLSNFLLWQAAYSEFLFLDLLWPDFTKEAFAEAVSDFHNRDRRFGVRP
ncbi:MULTISPECIES: isoprenyl transferase [Kordiimonas]|jgi:undecaprenyl diphosphate synthase|uniref:Isoprenyl transferase n=1 Tax=Kordiimonas lacus TaxID=637679 RepID=A0A1G6WBW6_9PROT|nr:MULTISPECIES: isoprenyl transferase [Kordiimonas]SDD63440.1 undecaprenyl diphosphate synthase [Kordiimonas lacus]